MKRNLLEFWKYRGLILALVGRHLRARYRGSILGFVWSFLNPLCLLAVYSFVFLYYMRFDSIENYSLFLFVGLLPWLWFSSGLLESVGSISGGGNLITKSLFPPHILPLVSVLTNLVHFLLAIPVLILFMLFSGVMPQLSLAWFPLVVFIELIFLAGLALMFSALNVQFRDVQHVLGNVMTFWFFLCPILYSVATIPDKFKPTIYLNPVALYTIMYRRIFLEGVSPGAMEVCLGILFAVVTFVLGNWVFNKCRDEFAELV